MANQTPKPIQFTPFKASDFASDSGVAFINQTLSQLTTTLNAFVGAGGPTVLPAGADLQGSTLTGVGSPTSPSDAVPLGHANSAYGAEAQRPQLDIGGKYALKGLTGLWSVVAQLQNGQPGSYAGGESVSLFGLVLKFGHSGTIPDGSPGLDIVFAQPFPTALKAAVAVDDFAAGGTRNISVVAAGSNNTKIQLWSDGSGAGAFWIAAGY